MKVNNERFVIMLTQIMDNYRNDKISYPWDAKNTSEKGNLLAMQLYLNTIAKINSLPRYANKFEDVELSQWYIPACFSDLIIPAAVCITDSQEAINLLSNSYYMSKEDMNRLPSMTYEAFMATNHALRRIFRKDETTWFKPVSQLRQVKLLADVLNQTSFEGQTRSYSCMPLSLQVRFFETSTYVFENLNSAKNYLQLTIGKDLGAIKGSNE